MSQRQAINLIVACDEDRVIGNRGRLPWRIPEDLAWLDEHTCEKTIILGRVCYETWPRVHAQGRRPIVVSSQQSLPANQAGFSATAICHDLGAALTVARSLPGDIFICGGQRIFEESLALATSLYLTTVEGHHEGDRWFPDWKEFVWTERFSRFSSDATHRYRFQILDRVHLD